MDKQKSWSKVRASTLELAKILDPTAEHVEEISMEDQFTSDELRFVEQVLQSATEKLRTRNEVGELSRALKLFAVYLIWFSVLYHWNSIETLARLLGFVIFSFVSFTWIVRSCRWILTTRTLFADFGAGFLHCIESAIQFKDWILKHIIRQLTSDVNLENSALHDESSGELDEVGDV